MKRRDFMKIAGGAGLATVLPGIIMPQQALAAGPFNGPILLTIFAGGGWDHSSFSDPRNNTSINHWARNKSAGTEGNLSYAPMGENAEFFRKYANDMLVFNGLNLRSGGHKGASRAQSTGALSGLPMSNALYAAIKGKELPLPWLLSRTDRHTEGIQPFTPLPSTKDLQKLVSDNKRDDKSVYFRNTDMDIINRYRLDRIQALQAEQSNLPYTNRKLEEMYKARKNGNLLSNLAKSSFVMDTVDLKGQNHRLIEPLNRILLASQAGLSATSSIRTTHNYDSHRNHDQNHEAGLTHLTRALDYVWEKATAMGIESRLVVHVNSDVGRRPSYNGKNGKDHSSIGSSFIMMKNQSWTGRVVGMSGPQHQAVKINPISLQEDPNGIYLTTAHVHHTLREILGIENESLSKRFSLNGPSLGLLSSNASSPVKA